jgi:DNA-binding MarR family transcriptional regulator
MSRNNANHLSEKEIRQSLKNEMQFLGQMLSTETALFHSTAAEKNGLSITDMKTISTLMQEGSMTAGQIAERLSLTTGAVTSLIDRLEKVGVVERASDPKDRRKVIVKIIPKKIQNTGSVYESMGKNFGDMLEYYSTEQIKFLVRYYKDSVELTKKEIAKLKKPN